MTNMQAAVVKEFGKDLIIEQVPIPTPGPGQALVKLITSGVCHTDLHAVEGDWPVKPNPPFIPGHEGVGKVVALGEGVTNLSVGQLVGNAWLFSACGHCQYCNVGWETLCEAQQNAGYSVDGSFGQDMPVDGQVAADIPDGAGLGGLGHIAVQYAKAMGLRVAAFDIADDKLALAKKHGAELLVNALKEDPIEVVQRVTGGAHGVLVTAVHPSAFGQAIHMSRRGGTIVFNGLPAGDFPASIFEIVLKGLTVRGSIVGTRQDLAEALEFYARGQIHPTVATRDLSEINAVFDEMKHGKIDGRVVIKY